MFLICLVITLVTGVLTSTVERTSIEVCDGEKAVKFLNNPNVDTFFNGSVIRGGQCVFSTKLVVIGSQGAGKSSLANSFLGWDRTYRGALPFTVGHGIKAGTLSSSYASGAWLGKLGSPGVTVVDTPGFNSSVQQLEDMVWMLGELEEVNTFVLVFRYKDRMSSELANSLKSVGRLLGNVCNNLAVVVSFWSFSAIDETERENRRINRRRYSEQVKSMLKNVLDTNVQIPVFFIDSHYNRNDPHQVKLFNKETSKLWTFLKDIRAWVSLPPAKLKAQVKRVRRRTGEIKEKCQVFEDDKTDWLERINNQKVMINKQDEAILSMRKTIDNLKNNCIK